uniref:Uncharacterized protein n=1 Tax=Setaria viridis TaxID=4556 RepID=A0A4U6U258_SETVI|nr:hypothetical protein SEVIR_7G302001v2 [Setaria viridis]
MIPLTPAAATGSPSPSSRDAPRRFLARFYGVVCSRHSCPATPQHAVEPGAAGDLVRGLEIGGHEDLPAAVAHVADLLEELMPHEGAHHLGGDVGAYRQLLAHVEHPHALASRLED